jgi:hypothetical protein
VGEGANVWVHKCEFRDSRLGMRVVNATATVMFSTFTNKEFDNNGTGAYVIGNSFVDLSDCSILNNTTGLHVDLF